MKIVALPDLPIVDVARKFAKLRGIISILIDDPDVERLLQLHLTEVSQQYVVVADALVAAEETAVEVPDDDLTAFQQLEETLRATLAEIIVSRGEEELRQGQVRKIKGLHALKKRLDAVKAEQGEEQ